MEKAIVSPLLVILDCPHCDEGMLDKPGLGNLWSLDDLRQVRTARCGDCHQESEVPQPGKRRHVVVRRKSHETEGTV